MVSIKLLKTCIRKVNGREKEIIWNRIKLKGLRKTENTLNWIRKKF